MFDNYPDTVQLIRQKENKDKFGYGQEPPVDIQVRFVGMQAVEINENNSYRVENRYLYQCPVELKETDKIVVNNKTLNVKSVYEVRDIFNNVIFWEAQLY